ncbi:MAG: hypothetical protein KGM91_04145 [Burkholderiales bacterium]|nr:hypothetical protein [Burkholderiales bacterium]
MKTLVAAGLLGAAATGFAADVGLSISISQPGIYGRVDIGSFPQPVVVAPQPVIIGRPVVAAPQPVYMWVPPGQRRNWGRYCAHYRACGVPVYFVDDGWYRQNVMRGERDDREDRGDRRGPGQERAGRGDHGNRGEHGGRGNHGHGGDRERGD